MNDAMSSTKSSFLVPPPKYVVEGGAAVVLRPPVPVALSRQTDNSRIRLLLKEIFSGQPHVDVACAAHIRDYPDFEYRALDWLLNAETNRWCYDFGDGARKCVERIKRHLDRAFHDKINMIHFDGFGWGLKRLPGYAATMRELNAYARDRGISLVFSGYGGGYGAIYQRQFKKQGKFFGEALRNRRGYPSGKIYKCMGIANPSNPVHTREFSRTVGSCVSNESLRAEKIKDIVRFVKQVEPGALYIHDLFKGSQIINHSNGHVHQEPLKVFDAMLFWNCDLSRGFMLPQAEKINPQKLRI